jgi:16S rRNA (cytosine967-C5)-methyltransferase
MNVHGGRDHDFPFANFRKQFQKLTGCRGSRRGLIDAPCSGSGTFRRNPGAKLTLTLELWIILPIFRKGWELFRACRPGGRLLYATCSLLKKENEERVQAFLQTHPDFSLVSADHVMSKWFPSISVTSPFMLLLPHKLPTDGFFAAIMTRRESSNR